MERNLTTGSVFKNIAYFSLPFLVSYFLQTLYGMADLFIIGKYGTVADITSVSVGSQAMHMLTVMIVGLAMGATVTIGRHIGAGDSKKASNVIGNAAVLFISLSVVLTVVLLLLINPIVTVMATPAEAVKGAADYLKICFIGIPFITAYNIISSVFRGIGDSKSPMVFVAIACAANIILDCIFMGVCGMGPAGAALGTTLSQTLSVIIALIFILKKDTGIKLSSADFKPVKEYMAQMLKIGVPVAAQDGFIQIAFIVITIIANQRGLNDAAAVGIVEKIIGIMFLVPSSMLSSVSAVSAQNLGAGFTDRARLTLKYAVCISLVFGVIVSAAMQLWAQNVVALFADDTTVTVLGGQYLRSYVWDCVFAGVHFSFSGYFCAMGKSGISFLHNVLSIILVRIPVAFWASKTFAYSLYPMGWAAPLGSLLSVVICVIAYYLIVKKEICTEKNIYG